MNIKGNVAIDDRGLKVRVIKKNNVYTIEISKEEKEYEITMEQLVYQSTENKEICLECYIDERRLDRVVFKRDSIWDMSIRRFRKNEYTDVVEEVECIQIDNGDRVCNVVKKIIRNYYKDRNLLDWYDYKYLKSRLDMYRDSFGFTGRDKGARYFYRYEVSPKSKTGLFADYAETMREADRIKENVGFTRQEEYGGEFYGVYTDEYNRRRPLTSPKGYRHVLDEIKVLEYILKVKAMPNFVVRQMAEKYGVRDKDRYVEIREVCKRFGMKKDLGEVEGSVYRDGEAEAMLDMDALIAAVDESTLSVR